MIWGSAPQYHSFIESKAEWGHLPEDGFPGSPLARRAALGLTLMSCARTEL